MTFAGSAGKAFAGKVGRYAPIASTLAGGFTKNLQPRSSSAVTLLGRFIFRTWQCGISK
jgi:hypothetical protein